MAAKCQGFLFQLDVYLAIVQPAPSGRERVAALISCLTGALEWANTVWREEDAALDQFELERKALIDHYRCNLREDVRRELACRNATISFDQLVDLSIWYDILLVTCGHPEDTLCVPCWFLWESRPGSQNKTADALFRLCDTEERPMDQTPIPPASFLVALVVFLTDCDTEVSPEEQAKETQQKEKKKSIHPAVAALQLFTLFCCGGKVKLRKSRPSHNRQSRKDQDKDASDTGSDLSGGDVTTKSFKDKINRKVGREKERTEVQLLKSSQDHEPENRRTPRQVKTPVEEIYIRPDSPTLPRAHSSLSQFSLARNLAILPLEWQLPGVPLPTSSMATKTERTPSSTNTSTHAQMETQTSDMNTDTQTTSTSQSQISMVSSETMIDLHTSDSITQTSTLDMALTPESTKDMITTDEDVKDDSAKDLISTLTDTSMEKSISETSLKDLIAEYEDDNELKDMAASATPATDNANEDAMLLEIAGLFD
ncbi:uncharacterized protein LOC116374754 [Oncorhynchus kisutch]|uniref:uncharacterized protein LOC116374754 n=1 Tax=Oncorhynchus kisutch TaxID=8019 RepID=UPI0012DE87ED|nr:uncharacterized protein LOC116374754 [Oncorhynchus kisutch]